MSSREPRLLQRTSALFLILEIVACIAVFAVFSIVTGDPATQCRWCAPNGFDEAVRRAIVGDDRLGAATLSHRLSFGFVPLLAFAGTLGPALISPRRRAAAQDAAIVLATFLLTLGVTDGVKKIASRERPGFFHGAVTEAASLPIERFVSFFSGDTALAFCLAACASTIAFLRGYRTAKWIAALGGLAAVATGVLRIRADMHWASDVLTGACVGTVVGVGLPLVLHRPKDVVAFRE